MRDRPRTFLLDENVPRKILTSLRREGFNAARVYDVGLRSQPDTAIFAYARVYQMTIITFDTDYLNKAIFPPVLATCGIRRPEWAYENTQSRLLLLANSLEEVYNLKHLPAHLHKGEWKLCKEYPPSSRG
jgi:Domain of unknown function (DUF5615)